MSKFKIAVSSNKAIRNSAAGVAICTVVIVVSLFNISCGPASNASAQNQSPQALALTGNLPQGVTHELYNSVLTVSGGNAPYQFTVQSGTLPPGTKLDPGMGSISGTPTDVGTYSFQVGVSDAKGLSGTQNFSIQVDSKNGVHISISPTSATVNSGQTQQFTAAVSGTQNTAVTWTATAGSVDSNGLFTAPNVKSQTNATITATSQADSKKSASAAVTIDPANGQLAITSGNPPDGQVGSPYGFTFTASGGTQPYSWSVTSGNLPAGLTLDGNGNLSGTPKSTGSSSFTVTVSDAKSNTATGNYAITINGSGTGNYDGPAELPRVTVNSALADTPAPGNKVTVNAGGNLQSALDNVQCGDTIALQSGASFSGSFNFRAKSCDDQHWIIVRTSASDSALPAEGQRVTPCYAGVGSLPGRPQYSCTHPQNVMAQLIYSGRANGPVSFDSGANHYRFVGLEITRAEGVKAAPRLISVNKDGTADHIVIDRSWLHGTTHDETQTGVVLSGWNYAAVVDSYFSDFHCTSGTGSCTDAHAIGGGLGNNQDGPFKIEDNFLEASGEAILFGGGAATTSPADITIRRNHFFKPMTWMKGSQGYVGGDSGNPFIVKNHLELKNAVRLLAEDNLMEDSWGGFSQNGFGIVIGPKSQHTKNGNVCPNCEVTDVTVRYTHIVHAGGGFELATSVSGHGKDQGGGQAKAGTRWSIHDLVLDDISQKYTGGGRLFEIANGWTTNPLNTVTINHVTGFADANGGLMNMGNQITNPSMYGLVFTNNITLVGRYPVWNTGGGSSSCAYHDVPVTSISTCFTTYTFTNNALVASPQQFGPSSWPQGNQFAATVNDVKFTDYNNANYQLQNSSPYHNLGTDGKDLGADIVGLNAALAGVE